MSRALIARVWGAGGARLLLGDCLVLGLLAAFVLAAAAPGTAVGRPTRAEVQVAGETVVSLELARDGVSEVAGPLGVTRIEVRGGRVRVLSSPCPGQSCRHGGWIGSAGELLVCLPNQVVVRIPGPRPGATDALAR